MRPAGDADGHRQTRMWPVGTAQRSCTSIAGGKRCRNHAEACWGACDPAEEIARSHRAGLRRALTEAAPVLIGYGGDIAIRGGRARGSGDGTRPPRGSLRDAVTKAACTDAVRSAQFGHNALVLETDATFMTAARRQGRAQNDDGHDSGVDGPGETRCIVCSERGVKPAAVPYAAARTQRRTA